MFECAHTRVRARSVQSRASRRGSLENEDRETAFLSLSLTFRVIESNYINCIAYLRDH